MKSYLKLISFLFLFSCQTQKKAESQQIIAKEIVYVLSDEITSAFADKIKDSTYFCLYSYTDYYELYISSSHNKYADITNRKLFIKGKAYPLIFDTDMWLGTTTSLKELKRQFDSSEYLETAKSVSIHEGFFVRFEKGTDKIIKSGYALASGNN